VTAGPGAAASEPRDRPVVLHADHSTSRGGAEYALMRMLQTEHPWDGVVIVPGRAGAPGVWEQFQREHPESISFAGAAHSAGASKSRRPADVLRFVSQVVGQAWTLRRHPAFRGADVLHANTSRAGLYSVVAALLTRKPVVVHLRDIVDLSNLGTLGLAITTRVVLPRASGVIGNSRASLQSAMPYLRPTTRTEVIPSAIGVERRAIDAPTSDEVRTIGMVARLDTWKGQDLLVRAFAAVHAGSSVRLVLAGSTEFGQDDYRRELEELAAGLGVGEQVDFLGHVENVAELISRLDVCVQASTRPEPLGQNVLQYLSLGRPTIATDAGGPAEWVTNGVNGLTFEMGSVTALSEALRLLGDPDLRRRLAAAAAVTPGLLSDSEVAERHGAFFSSVVRTRQTKRR